MATTISQLAAQVIARVEETNPPVFWNLQNEVYSAIVEGISDLLLLIARPTNTVNLPIILLPNQTIQPMPPDVLCITNIYGPSGSMYKMGLFDLDFTQSSWGSGWMNDISDSLQRWFPLGFTSFGIHPAVSVPQPVNVTGIQLVTTEAWPYQSDIVFPFADEVMSAVEKYAAHYLSFKEGGAEFAGSMALYDEFLSQAHRLSEISDRRDSWLFTCNVGVQTGVPQTTAR